MNAVFQSAATRTAGMNSVNIGSLTPGLLIVMILSMYVVAYPVLFAIRRSNTSERNQKKQEWHQKAASEGLHAPAIFAPGTDHPIVNWQKYAQLKQFQKDQGDILPDLVQQQKEAEALAYLEERLAEQEEVQRELEQKHGHISTDDTKKEGLTQRLCRKYTQTVLFRDISWVYIAILLICFAEGRALDEGSNNDTSVFKVIFEVVSAFGTVGFSMGYKDAPYSYSGVLTTTSKFVMVVIMMLGRHRGLPSSDDPAVVPANYASLRAFRARRRSLCRKMKVRGRSLDTNGVISSSSQVGITDGISLSFRHQPSQTHHDPQLPKPLLTSINTDSINSVYPHVSSQSDITPTTTT